MSEFKFLIDTNVVIGLEDNHLVEAALAEFVRRCSANGVRIFVDEETRQDIQRDDDKSRRAITESKLRKFESLRGVPYPTEATLQRRFGAIRSENDKSDCRLLFCLEIGAADFLVTRDKGLQRRAAHCGFENAVLSVEDANQWLRQTFEPTAVELPYLLEKDAYAINLEDSLFDSLRSDYTDFDKWYREKCAQEHRKCWVIDVGGVLAGIAIRKDERRVDAPFLKAQGEKILKICTLKVGEKFRGEKFGEQLLKQVLWFAQVNRYDLVYLTAYPDKEDLIDLLEQYGFEITRRQRGDGELVLEKVLRYGALLVDRSSDILAIDKKCYPRFYDGPLVSKFCAPIRGPYHERLFPEISFEPTLPLFSGIGLPRTRTVSSYSDRTPGNTIRKVYLCRAKTKKMRPGDLILFYLSKNERLDASQSITTVGVIEAVHECGRVDDLLRLTARRSVFSREELEKMQQEARGPIKVIDFLLSGHVLKFLTLGVLIAEGVFHKAPPQSICRLSEAKYDRIRPLIDFGYQ